VVFLLSKHTLKEKWLGDKLNNQMKAPYCFKRNLKKICKLFEMSHRKQKAKQTAQARFFDGMLLNDHLEFASVG